MVKWDIISAPPASVSAHIAADWELFQAMEAGAIAPTVRLYTWSQPGITCGYLQSDQPLASWVPPASFSAPNSDIVRRPTGGGVVFHETDEVVYCLAAPNDPAVFPNRLSDAYYQISRMILNGLQSLGLPVSIQNLAAEVSGLKSNRNALCFATPEDYEIVLTDGTKIVGIAQRRTRHTILQQGTIKTKCFREFF